MNSHIQNLRNHLTVLEAFGAKYQLDIPDRLTQISVSYETPIVNIYPAWAPNEKGKEKILAHIGITFGVRGWTAKPMYDNNSYDWSQTFDGVEVIVHEAEKMPKLVEHAVPTNAWPILLEDTQASEDNMENYH